MNKKNVITRTILLIVVELICGILLIESYIIFDARVTAVGFVLSLWFVHSYLREEKAFYIKVKIIIMVFIEVPVVYFCYYSFINSEILLSLLSLIVAYIAIDIFLMAENKKNLKEIKRFFIEE